MAPVRNVDILAMTPYLATILERMSSSSVPVTRRAVPSVDDVPSRGRPRRSHGWTITRSPLRRRFALPESELVQNPNVPSANGVHHTGLATAVPSRLNVVNNTYFSPLTSMDADRTADPSDVDRRIGCGDERPWARAERVGGRCRWRSPRHLLSADMEDLADKVAVVTGAGSGIGRGIARALADAGVAVAVADIEQGGAEAVAAELVGADVDAIAVRCDVADREDVEALADAAWAHFGHVDVMVNNAGVIGTTRRCIEADERDARWICDVNVFGTWHGCSVFGKRFVEQGTPAHILNTGSENSLGVPHTGAAFYTASKHAVLGLTDVLRHELPDFIGVSILCPGMVQTRLSSAARNRPDQYGGPIESDARIEMGMDADEVGRRAVEGIRAGAFYIVTHPPVRELVEERAAEILAAFDTQAPRYAGDEVLDTRATIQRMREQAGRQR